MNVQVGEVVPCLFLRGGTQTLIVLDFPTTGVVVKALLPRLILGHRVEDFNLPATARLRPGERQITRLNNRQLYLPRAYTKTEKRNVGYLDDWCDELKQESRNFQQGREEAVQKVHYESLDM